MICSRRIERFPSLEPLRRLIAAVALALIAVPAAAAQAQRSAAAPATFTASAGAIRARAVLDRAARAVFGTAVVAPPASIRRTYTGATTDEWQGGAPVVPERPEPILDRFSGELVVDYTGRRLMQRERGAVYGGQPFTIVRHLTPTHGVGIVVEQHVADTIPTSVLAQRFASRTLRYPERLIPTLLAEAGQLQSLGRVTLSGGVRADAVAYASGAEQMVVLFDARTGLPVGLQVAGSRGSLGDVTTEIRLGDWRTVGGLRLPFSEIERANGRDVRRVSYGAIEPGAAFPPDSTLAPGPDFRPTLTPGDPTALAPGVVVVPGAYNTMFVEFDRYVVVLEPVLSAATSRRVIDVVRRMAPDKPIRYVVVTHFHNDHIGGVAPYIQAGATVITTAHAAAVLPRLLSVPRRLAGDTTAVRITPDRVRIVSDTMTISDGNRELRLHQIGPNPHAEQILVALVPAQGILFEGDVLDIPSDFPMAGDDTVALARWLCAAGITPTTIVPVHGRVGTAADLRRALERFGTRLESSFCPAP